jgi:hypothetical protein
MKVSRLLFALLLVSAPVLMAGSAYADPCIGSNCKSKDTPPVDNPAAPVPLLTAPPERTADPCSGSNCIDSVLTAPVRTAEPCTGSSCKGR